MSEETMGTLSEHLDKALQCLTDEFNAGRSGPSGLRAQAIAHVRYSIPLAHRLRADLEAARRDAITGRAMVALLDEIYPESVYADLGMLRQLITDLAQSRATEAELRTKMERRDAVVDAVRAYVEYCRVTNSVYPSAFATSLAALAAAEQPARAEQGQG